jgi:hypothetical protein
MRAFSASKALTTCGNKAVAIGMQDVPPPEIHLMFDQFGGLDRAKAWQSTDLAWVAFICRRIASHVV